MKLFLLGVLVMLNFLLVSAQAVENASSIRFRTGTNRMPGWYFSGQYQHTTASSLDFSTSIFYESCFRHGLQYRAYGMDLMALYRTPLEENTDQLFSVLLGIGATGQIESEPEIYKDWPFYKRLNYGLIGELSVGSRLSDAFSLFGFVQQKILFNTSLGRYRNIIGVGLQIHFDQ